MKKLFACAVFASMAMGMSASSASAAVILGPFVGTLDGTDPSMNERLFRSSPASTCLAPTTALAFGGVTVSYETFTFFNSGPAECITVTYSSTGTLSDFDFLSAYANNFNPLDVLDNYLADAGESAGGNSPIVFSFMVAADSPFVIVANSVDDLTGGPFSFTVSGDSINVGAVAAPEPATLALLGLGFAALRARRRQR
jgi:PEP-CTERM motif